MTNKFEIIRLQIWKENIHNVSNVEQTNFEGILLLIKEAVGSCRQRKILLVRFCQNWVVLKFLTFFYHSYKSSAWELRSISCVICPRLSFCGIIPVCSEVCSFWSKWRIGLYSDYIWLGYTSNIHTGPKLCLITWESKFGNSKFVAKSNTWTIARLWRERKVVDCSDIRWCGVNLHNT